MRYITSPLIIAAVLTGGIAVAPAAAAPAVVDADSSVATAADSFADANTEATVTARSITATVATSDGASTRVIVHLDAPVLADTTASADDIVATRTALRSAQNAVTRQLAGTGSVVTDTYTLIPAMAAQLTPAGVARLADDPTVVSIERDVALPPVLDGTTSIVTADDLWATGVDGTDWAVAVLDTGVDTDHPMFSDGNGGTRVVAEACFSYTATFDRAVVDDDGNTTYENHARSDSLCPGGATSSTATGSGADCASSIAGCGHGTHVAGFAAGGEVNTGATTMNRW